VETSTGSKAASADREIGSPIAAPNANRETMIRSSCSTLSRFHDWFQAFTLLRFYDWFHASTLSRFHDWFQASTLSRFHDWFQAFTLLRFHD